MKFRNKPKMGTRLVPSIENIEGCYKYGGTWNHKDKVCYERRDRPSIEGMSTLHYSGCMAPMKGINLCWGTKQIGTEKYRPYVDFVLSATGDVVRSEFLQEDDNARPHAKDIYDWVKKSELKKEPGEKIRICCNPRGKIIGCNEPNAIITNIGENISAIAHNYRSKFGDRVLSNLLPVKREYVDKERDWTIGTKISHLEGIPALESQKDSGYFFGLHGKYQAEQPTEQLSLKGEKFPVSAVMREKIVPSVETPAECFKWGGKWDKKNKICLSKRGWSTAPAKGVECHWGAIETECVKYNDKKRGEEWAPCYRPYVTCEMLDEDGESMDQEEFFIYDTIDSDYFSDDYGRYDGYDYPLEEKEAYEEAKEHGIETANEILTGHAYDLNYYTPWGEECDYDHPHAVAATDPKKVVEIYKDVLRRKDIKEEFDLPKMITSHLLESQKKLNGFSK